ncbi:hypothetical protein JB92DRAFT_2829157 [Gautieria morchelliformis]|nr:hypothetical protein JB92DRAFT_2829157 [Gautieria morchelliformis]
MKEGHPDRTAPNNPDPEAIIQFTQIRSIRELQTCTLFAIDPEIEVNRNKKIFHTRISGRAPLLVWAERWDPIYETGTYYPSTLKLRAWKIATTELTEPARVIRLGFPNDHVEKIIFSITRNHEKWHFIWIFQASAEEPLSPVSIRTVCQPLVLAPNSRLMPPHIPRASTTTATVPHTHTIPPTAGTTLPVTQKNLTHMSSKVNVFKGSPGQGGNEWLQTFEKACYERGIDADKAEKLKYLKLCLSGEAMRQFRSWDPVYRTSWSAFTTKWGEVYPSHEILPTIAETFSDWQNTHISEAELLTKTVDEEQRPVWALVKFAQTLSELGARLTGMDAVTKSHYVFQNLPLLYSSHYGTWITSDSG